MPNIAIIKHCNLKCPYCFADDMIQENESKEISLEQFQNILNWIGRIPLQGHIGIIGGEPTLHTQFKEILYIISEFCNRNNIKTVIFTNGINLYKYTHLINDTTDFLVNINKLNDINKNLLIKSLDECNILGLLKERIFLGCNLYSLNEDYSFFWEIVDRYKDINVVRMSITAPVLFEDKQNKFLYYKKMKPILFKFLKEAKKRKLKVSYDCNQLPVCLLTNDELNYINSFGDYKMTCTPVVDITADFKASSCFGTYEDTLIDCNKFNDLNEIERYFQSKIFQKTLKNNHQDCSSCEKFNLLKCQGGCLGFVKEDKII